MTKLKPALLVGIALGLLLVSTGVLSLVTRVGGIGCCNCLWPVVGGLLATLWYIKSSPVPAGVGDGAQIGLVTGLVGGLIELVIIIPVQIFSGNIQMAEAQIRQVMPDFPLSGIALAVIVSIIGFVIFLVLSLIGGLIAVPIFEKRKGDSTAPPPPQNYGGGSYGSAA
jgi:hypothetical protein